jgi:hypothetical protein
VTIWVDTVRVLTLGDLYSPQTSDLFANVKSLGTLLWLSIVWFTGFLALFSFLGVRTYRRT